MNSVLVGVFDTQLQASQARAKLLAAGFTADQVIVTGDTTSSSASTTTTTVSDTSQEPEKEGAIARFFKSLFGSDDVAERYAEGATYKEAFRRGACSVSVTADNDDDADTAERILNECGAVDVDERSAQWRQEGWTADQTTLETGDIRKLQEVEEELKVGKRAVARGGVRIFNRVTEVPVEESVSLREERANVQRHAVDRPATEADLAAFKEGSIEVREMSEEAVVSKTARVVGEVEIGKEVTEHEEAIHGTVRKTEVDVEEIEPSNQSTYKQDKTSSQGSSRSR